MYIAHSQNGKAEEQQAIQTFEIPVPPNVGFALPAVADPAPPAPDPPPPSDVDGEP
jgi:hypothetical protein